MLFQRIRTLIQRHRRIRNYLNDEEPVLENQTSRSSRVASIVRRIEEKIRSLRRSNAREQGGQDTNNIVQERSYKKEGGLETDPGFTEENTITQESCFQKESDPDESHGFKEDKFQKEHNIAQEGEIQEEDGRQEEDRVKEENGFEPDRNFQEERGNQDNDGVLCKDGIGFDYCVPDYFNCFYDMDWDEDEENKYSNEGVMDIVEEGSYLEYLGGKCPYEEGKVDGGRGGKAKPLIFQSLSKVTVDVGGRSDSGESAFEGEGADVGVGRFDAKLSPHDVGLDHRGLGTHSDPASGGISGNPVDAFPTKLEEWPPAPELPPPPSPLLLTPPQSLLRIAPPIPPWPPTQSLEPRVQRVVNLLEFRLIRDKANSFVVSIASRLDC